MKRLESTEYQYRQLTERSIRNVIDVEKQYLHQPEVSNRYRSLFQYKNSMIKLSVMTELWLRVHIRSTAESG